MRRPSRRGVGNVDPSKPTEFDEVESYMVSPHTARIDKDKGDSVQVSDVVNVSVVLPDSEHWDLHHGMDRAGWQDRSIPNSSVGESGAPSSSSGPRRTKGGAVIGCGAPPPPPRVLFCAFDDGVANIGHNAFASDNDEEVFPSDAQLNLARLLHANAHARARDLVFTRRALVQQIKRNLGKDSEGHDGRRWDYAVADDDGRDDGGLWDLECDGERNRCTGALTCTGDLMCTGDLTCTGMLTRREEPPSPPVSDDASATGRTYMQNAMSELGEDIEGRDGRWWVADDDGRDGGLWDLKCDGVMNRHTGVLVCTGVLTRREESPSPPVPDDASATGRTYMQKAMRELGKDVEGHDGRRWVADDDGRDGGLWDLECDGERNRRTGMLTCTGALTRREESPSPPALDDVSATGRTYDDITESPPPHLLCVASPLFSLPLVFRCTAASLPRFFFADVSGLRRV